MRLVLAELSVRATADAVDVANGGGGGAGGVGGGGDGVLSKGGSVPFGATGGRAESVPPHHDTGLMCIGSAHLQAPLFLSLHLERLRSTPARLGACLDHGDGGGDASGVLTRPLPGGCVCGGRRGQKTWQQRQRPPGGALVGGRQWQTRAG